MRHRRRDEANAELCVTNDLQNLGPEVLNLIGAAHKTNLDQCTFPGFLQQSSEILERRLRLRQRIQQQRIVR